MASNVRLLDNPTQRAVQLALLEYQVDQNVSQSLSKVELRNWTPAQIHSILKKVNRAGPRVHPIAPAAGSSWFSTFRQPDTLVQPPAELVEQAAKEGLALCVNVDGQWSLCPDNYVAISHVWEEGIQADVSNRGLSKRTLDWIFTQIKTLSVQWVWLDCLAIPGGNKTLTAAQEVVKKDIINSLAKIYRNADAVIIFDALVMKLRSQAWVDVAVVLLCGKWLTRLWTLQEICLARKAVVLTATGSVVFKDIVRALRYLMGDKNDLEDMLGPHDDTIERLVSDSPSKERFFQIYLRLLRLMRDEGKIPTLAVLALSCHGRRTGNDIDYARAFFPLLGLEWQVHYTREEGMNLIYQSQRYFAMRMILMHGSPRSSFKPGWAPSYLTGLSGLPLHPEDELGDIQWMKRGLSRKWWTYQILSHQQTADPNLLIVYASSSAQGGLGIACKLDPRESSASRDGYVQAISAKTAFLLSNVELLFPTSNGLCIPVLLVERDNEAEKANEAWVYCTVEVACPNGARGLPEIQQWLLLHDSPVSTHFMSGKGHTRVFRMTDYTNAPPSDDLVLNAIQKKDLETFAALMSAGVALSGQDSRGCGPLHLAVLAEQADMVDMLLEKGVDVDAQNKYGRTALNLAAEQGNFNIVQLLLAFGADVNLHPHDEPGTLQQAIIKHNHDIITTLIDNGAKVNEKDTWGWYPLFNAAHDPKATKILLDAGADPDTKLVGGSRPIHSAARLGQNEIIEMLLERDIDVDQRESQSPEDDLQPTALYRAIEEQQTSTVELLLSCGADANLRFENGWTSVLLAAKVGNYQILRLIVNSLEMFERPLQVNDATTPEGWTALHLAAKGGHRIVAKLLTESGWDCAALDAQERTPAALANEFEQTEIVDLLRNLHLR